MKAISQKNIVQLLLDFSASLLVGISLVEWVRIVLSTFQSFECLYKCCFDPNQIKRQLMCRLCIDDNMLKSSETYFLCSLKYVPIAPIFLSLLLPFLLLHIRCVMFSYFCYFFLESIVELLHCNADEWFEKQFFDNLLYESKRKKGQESIELLIISCLF